MSKIKFASDYRQIGEIRNLYGSLHIDSNENGRFWGIGNHLELVSEWQEIPDYLYDALVRFQNEQDAGTSAGRHGDE